MSSSSTAKTPTTFPNSSKGKAPVKNLAQELGEEEMKDVEEESEEEEDDGNEELQRQVRKNNRDVGRLQEMFNSNAVVLEQLQATIRNLEGRNQELLNQNRTLQGAANIIQTPVDGREKLRFSTLSNGPIDLSVANKDNRWNQKPQQKKEFKCYNCDKPGHMARDCRQPKRIQGPPRQASVAQKQRDHSSEKWTNCFNDLYNDHREAKENSRWYPKDPSGRSGCDTTGMNDKILAVADRQDISFFNNNNRPLDRYEQEEVANKLNKAFADGTITMSDGSPDCSKDETLANNEPNKTQVTLLGNNRLERWTPRLNDELVLEMTPNESIGSTRSSRK
nr:reverse transcriptase domain protein [Colletotrichum truncatum]KAF6782466.1 reverse transcriptase domain protein [Colletotrichum truncatum]